MNAGPESNHTESEMVMVRLCATSDLEPGSSRRIDIEGHRIAVVRIVDDWYAIGDECSHADFSLAEGPIDDEECAIECPKHGSLFDLTTGQPLTLPATRPVASYELVVEGSDVFVRLAKTDTGEGA